MALRVAEAPSVAVNRVATYRELDSDLLRHVAFATIDDIDLRLLTKGKIFSDDCVFTKCTFDYNERWLNGCVNMYLTFSQCLAPESALREPDVAWSWDEVFAEVSGELQREWFPEEEAEEKAQAAQERPYTAFNRFAV